MVQTHFVKCNILRKLELFVPIVTDSQIIWSKHDHCKLMSGQKKMLIKEIQILNAIHNNKEKKLTAMFLKHVK